MRNPEEGDIVITTSEGWNMWNNELPYFAKIEHTIENSGHVRVAPLSNEGRSQLRQYEQIFNCTAMMDELVTI